MHKPAIPAFISASGTIGPQGAGIFPRYLGIAVRETGGGALVIRIRRGGAVTGAIIDSISSPTNTTVPQRWYGPEGVEAEGGIYVELVSGTVEAVVYFQ